MSIEWLDLPLEKRTCIRSRLFVLLLSFGISGNRGMLAFVEQRQVCEQRDAYGAIVHGAVYT